MGSGLDDWIYCHFFTITINCNNSHTIHGCLRLAPFHIWLRASSFLRDWLGSDLQIGHFFSFRCPLVNTPQMNTELSYDWINPKWRLPYESALEPITCLIVIPSKQTDSRSPSDKGMVRSDISKPALIFFLFTARLHTTKSTVKILAANTHCKYFLKIAEHCQYCNLPDPWRNVHP
jgi:hypothetical protein